MHSQRLHLIMKNTFVMCWVSIEKKNVSWIQSSVQISLMSNICIVQQFKALAFWKKNLLVTVSPTLNFTHAIFWVFIIYTSFDSLSTQAKFWIRMGFNNAEPISREDAVSRLNEKCPRLLLQDGLSIQVYTG